MQENEAIITTRSELLVEVRNRLDRAEFTPALVEYADKLFQFLGDDAQSDEYWEARNLLAEVYDHSAEREKSIGVTQGAEKLRLELESLDWNRELNTKLLREQIRHVLFWGQVVYRKDDYAEAEKIILFCDRFVQRLLVAEGNNEEHLHWGTRGLIQYFLGRIYRHQDRTKEAITGFEESVSCYYRRARNPPRDKKDAVAVQYSYFRVAKAIALGVGWCRLALNEYSEALRQNFIPASVLLAFSADDLNKQRVLMLEATAECALAKTDEELDKAIAKLEGTQPAFEAHPRYRAKTAQELCLAYIQRRRWVDARMAYDAFVEAVSGTKRDWQSHVLQSTLFRAQGTAAATGVEAGMFFRKALQCARQAVEAADPSRVSAAALIEVKTNLGEALVSAGEFNEARVTLLQVRVLCGEAGKDRRVAYATCCLALADACAGMGELGEATSCLSEWAKNEGYIEHQGLLARADRVKQKVMESVGFAIPKGEDFLDYKAHQHRLQGFLMSSAEAQLRTASSRVTDKAIAEIIGITPLALKAWRNNQVREEKIRCQLELLCKSLGDYENVLRFRAQLRRDGGYVLCRRVLGGHLDESCYKAVYELACKAGEKAETVEAIVVAEAKYDDGLFGSGERNLAERTLLKDTVGNRKQE